MAEDAYIAGFDGGNLLAPGSLRTNSKAFLQSRLHRTVILCASASRPSIWLCANAISCCGSMVCTDPLCSAVSLGCAHMQLSCIYLLFTLDVTHVIKCTRSSHSLCNRKRHGSGNEATHTYTQAYKCIIGSHRCLLFLHFHYPLIQLYLLQDTLAAIKDICEQPGEIHGI